ncbi:peroxiredoxin [Aureococcus anophagefferens]|nr:peroxiredoxin [Aureococcus anophagefferens]
MAASKSRKELRQDWADQPADGVSTTQELYLRETEDSDDDDDDRDYLAMQIGDDLPDFTAESTHGEIKFYEATENQWTLFVSFSRNYDPVATSELAQLAKMLPEFDERKVRVYGHSCNTQTNHEKWIQATEELLDCTVTFPLIADHEARVARLFGLVRHGCRVPVPGLLPASLVAQYPDTTGRNFDEIIRAVDALQLRHANPTVACGVNWMVGEDVFITNDVPKAKAKELFPRGFVEIRPWFRLAPPPEAGS